MIQVYTGNGKGKTTAAFGLALRAAGAGLKVYIGQFLKGKCYSELNSIKKHKNIKIEQFGRRCFVKSKPQKKDIELAKRGFEKVKKNIAKECFNLIILDEINIAVHLGCLKLKGVISLLKNSPKTIELVLTGRYAHPQVLKLADLVSEIKEIKHYYKKGVKARKGIEN
ncbi:MAG: cob(I)yrinic acid a,c-diamide adenosyltransferase [Candidatus Omnitrophota bacterium]